MILPLIQRASNADRTFSCHGSLTAVPLVPEREDDGGVEGSLLHYLIAKRLVLELGAIEPEGGLVAPVLPKGYKLPAFSAWIVDWGVKWVRDNIPPDWTLMVEVPISYRYELPRPLWVRYSEIQGTAPASYLVRPVHGGEEVLIDHFYGSGHIDVFAMSPDGTRSKSCDWKSGPVGADPAESNWQASFYLGLEKMGWPDLQHSEFTLAQPRIDEEATGIPRISTVEMTGEQLDAMNVEIAEQMNRALENRFETNSGIKACRWCPVAANRPYACPSLIAEEAFMKAQITQGLIEKLKGAVDDAALGDFVISGRTLNAPIEAATELLHERIAAHGYVDAGSGTRITVKTRPGHYEIPDMAAFWSRLKLVLPAEDRRVKCIKPSMGSIRDEIAEDRGIPQKSKVPGKESGTSVFDEQLRPLTEQKETKLLVFT